MVEIYNYIMISKLNEIHFLWLDFLVGPMWELMCLVWLGLAVPGQRDTQGDFLYSGETRRE